jgi:hypothetical protein
MILSEFTGVGPVHMREQCACLAICLADGTYYAVKLRVFGAPLVVEEPTEIPPPLPATPYEPVAMEGPFADVAAAIAASETL